VSRCPLRIGLVCAIFLSFGGHLALIQSAAWVRMAMRYSRHDSLQSSLQKTFDGRHPCAMCIKVKKAASSDQSLGAAQTNSSLDVILPFGLSRISKCEASWAVGSPSLFSMNYHSEIDPPPPESIFS
jgi:hypothetical protein